MNFVSDIGQSAFFKAFCAYFHYRNEIVVDV